MSRPNWIAANVIADLQGIVATLETIYSTATLDPVQAAGFKLAVATAPAISATTPAATSDIVGLWAAMSALFNGIPFLVSDVTGVDPSVGPGLMSLAAGLAAAMDAHAAADAFAAAVDATLDPAPAPGGATPNRVADSDNGARLARFARHVYLSAYTRALVSSTFDTRAAAITARADSVGRFERELARCGGASDIAVAGALIALRDAAVAWLNAAIIDARPVIDVTTPTSWPALVAAWRLYQDPTRASELIARNVTPTVEFMPTTFEAKAA